MLTQLFERTVNRLVLVFLAKVRLKPATPFSNKVIATKQVPHQKNSFYSYLHKPKANGSWIRDLEDGRLKIINLLDHLNCISVQVAIQLTYVAQT